LRLETVVEAQPRASRGKNEARRTRRQGLIPGIVYGAFKDSESVSVNPKDILKIIRSRTGHNSIFDINIDGVERTPVIVADEQYDPLKGSLLHIDFKRIDLSKKLRISVPIHVSASNSRAAFWTSSLAPSKSNAFRTTSRTNSGSMSPSSPSEPTSASRSCR
jgi:ribosomal protein bL25 (Ctc-form)